MGAKTRELIALAAAVSLRCDGCIAVHTVEARTLRASKDEIAEALGVAMHALAVTKYHKIFLSEQSRKSIGPDGEAGLTTDNEVGRAEESWPPSDLLPVQQSRAS